MGADLYNNAVFTPVHDEWEPEFERAARARDVAPEGAARQAAQLLVDQAYERMHSRGYFRDSYNDWNLLWKFGLSWWQDVMPMLDAHDQLSTEQARCLLDMLREREHEFDAALADVEPNDRVFFQERYAALKAFLNEAIELNQPIECSL